MSLRTTPILRRGIHDPLVGRIQERLGIRPTNFFGPLTEEAVMRFQKENGLVVDGIVGQRTLERLGLLQLNMPEFLMIHCSATPENNPRWNAQAIVNLHLNQFRWGRPGYSRIIEYNGDVVETWRVDLTDGFDPATERTNGATNINSRAIHIAYVGGLDASGRRAKDTRTREQSQSLEKVVKEIVQIVPTIKILGHNQWDRKDCPCFWVPDWLESININTNNIYYEDPFKLKPHQSRWL